MFGRVLRTLGPGPEQSFFFYSFRSGDSGSLSGSIF